MSDSSSSDPDPEQTQRPAATAATAANAASEVARPLELADATPATVGAPPAAVDAPVAETPAPSPPWRFWPSSRWQRAAVIASSALLVVYVVAGMVIRFRGIFDPWSCDGDQAQAVWQYWRYHVTGAFPPGDLLTDYAFVMHAPPVWWAMMASLSHVVTPLFAAKLLNLVAYVATIAVMWFAVTLRSNHFVGIAAAFLLARSLDFHGITAGGYARSFGPLLCVAFIALFFARRHTATLVFLVFAAALYPSVVMPCTIAYGVYVVVAGPMRDRLRRMAGMFVAGLLIIACGEYQSFAAPKWWGDVVTLKQALAMPAWGPGGRIHEAPLRPVGLEFTHHLGRAFTLGGHVPLRALGELVLRHDMIAVFGGTLAALAVLAALALRRRRRGEKLDDPPPWELALLFASAVAAYFLARALAFKLYLPYRPLQHVLAYVIYAGVPLLWWSILRNGFALAGRRALRAPIAAGVAALVVSTVPFVVAFGDGLTRGPTTYFTNAANQKLYKFVRKLPIDVQLAGPFRVIDRIPLFAYHRVYVTKNLAHPFRAGYYAEAERRIEVVYDALYSSDLAAIVASLEKEHVDYFAFDPAVFRALDRTLFNPVRTNIARIYNANKATGFALERVPRDCIVYQDRTTRIVSVEKLRKALARGEVSARAPAPSSTEAAPFIGPQRAPRKTDVPPMARPRTPKIP